MPDTLRGRLAVALFQLALRISRNEISAITMATAYDQGWRDMTGKAEQP